MAWTTLINALFLSGKPILGSTGVALRDNLAATVAGDSGAPRIQFAAMDTWFSGAGDVGSLCFATRTTGTGDVAFGSTLAGSNLSPTSAMTSNTGSSGNMLSAFGAGSALFGTWRAMGQYDHQVNGSGGGDYRGATLWKRIA